MSLRRRDAAAVGVAAALLVLPLAGCGGDDGSSRELTVLAAASLTDVYEELAAGFEDEEDVTVTFSFGSSTVLAEQAAEGAPGDVLATADEAAMRIAEDAGVTGEVTTVATNVLTVVTPPGNPAGVATLEGLDGTTWVRCADEVPCGRVALAVLDARGITAAPASLEDDVRAALDKVVAGEVDAGLVYATDAVAAGDGVETVPIPGAEEQQTAYLTAVLDQAGDADLARTWVDHVTSTEGRAALEAAGFTVP